MKKALWLLSLLVLTVSLTACGGSSGSSDTTTSTPSGLSGAVAAAPVKDASVMVDYKYLTAAAQKAAKTTDAVKVGYTNASGAIVFDDAAMAKVDRTKDVIVYSTGGVQFKSVENTVKAVKDAGKEASDLFNGSLRAVLAKGATTAYLTPANTIVADKVIAGATYAEAKEFALNLIQNKLGIIGMTNPLGNPLTDLTKSEVVSQVLMSVCGTNEAAVVAGTAKFTVPADPKISETDFKAALAAAKTVLEEKDGFVADADALKYENAVSAKARTVELKASAPTNTFPLTSDETANSHYVKEADVASFTFSVQAYEVLKDVKTSTGKYVLKAVDATGTFKANGIEAKVGTVFDSVISFEYTPAIADADKGMQDADRKAFSKASFTFEAVDAAGKAVENVEPVTVKITKISPKEILVKSFAKTALFATTYEINPGGEKISIGDKNANPVNLPVNLELVNKLTTEDLKNTVVRYTAPSGYLFEYVDDGKTVTSSVLDKKLVDDSGATSFPLNPSVTFVKLGSLAVDRDIETMTVAFIDGEKELAKQTITVGFAAKMAYFTKIRNFALNSATKEIAFAGSEKAFTGKLTATYSTWAHEVAAANKDTFSYAAETFNLFYVQKSDSDTDYMYKAKAIGKAVTPARVANDKGVVTATFALNDLSNDADTTAAAVDTYKLTLAAGTYFVRVAPQAVAAYVDTLDKDLPVAGGFEVEAVSPNAVASIAKETSATKPAINGASTATVSFTNPVILTVTVEPSDATAALLGTDASWTATLASNDATASTLTATVAEVTADSSGTTYTVKINLVGDLVLKASGSAQTDEITVTYVPTNKQLAAAASVTKDD